MTIGVGPIGSYPIGTEVVRSTSYLTIPALNFYFEIPDCVVDDGFFNAEPVELWYEIPGIVVSTQHPLSTLDAIELQYEIPDITVGFDHNLSVGNVEFFSELTSPSIAPEHTIVIGDVEVQFELTAVSVGQAVGLAVDPLEFYYEAPDVTVISGINLEIPAVEAGYSIRGLWVSLPRGCISYASTRRVDGGVMVDTLASEVTSTGRWYTEDRYEFTIVWEHVSRDWALAFSGFFKSYRYDGFVFLWPEDGNYYSAILADDVIINQNSHRDDWRAELRLVSNGVVSDPSSAQNLIRL
jgi:hypothetical protein